MDKFEIRLECLKLANGNVTRAATMADFIFKGTDPTSTQIEPPAYWSAPISVLDHLKKDQ